MKKHSKKILRQKMKKIRRKMTVWKMKVLSKKVITNLMGLKKVKEAKSFFIYVSIGNEVQTHDLIKKFLKEEKIVTVPKVIGEGLMDAYQIKDWHQLKPGKYNILSPTTIQPYKRKLDVCIAPSVALTIKRHRLGKGKGYYDRFLTKRQDMFVVALAFNQQIVSRIPLDQTDRLVDIIVTEDRIIR